MTVGLKMDPAYWSPQSRDASTQLPVSPDVLWHLTRSLYHIWKKAKFSRSLILFSSCHCLCLACFELNYSAPELMNVSHSSLLILFIGSRCSGQSLHLPAVPPPLTASPSTTATQLHVEVRLQPNHRNTKWERVALWVPVKDWPGKSWDEAITPTHRGLN